MSEPKRINWFTDEVVIGNPKNPDAIIRTGFCGEVHIDVRPGKSACVRPRTVQMLKTDAALKLIAKAINAKANHEIKA